MAYGKSKDAKQCTGQEALASAYRSGKSDIGTIAKVDKSSSGASGKGSISKPKQLGK
jgi:hypothetical protein